MAPTRIVLDRLTKTFPTQPTPVLKELSLDVHPGELVALLGPSGSGKSTLLKLIAGIEQVDSGDICFDGHSVLAVLPNRRAAVLMFQEAYLFPFMNVANNIGFGLKMQGASKQVIRGEVARMLELVELVGIERKYPAQLSGGQLQRVALARALVVKPKVLLLDEPLSSLDAAIRLTLQETICRIQSELGVTTVLVTHDRQEAITMSNRMALLLDGLIKAYDRPERLFHRPPTKDTACFMGISTLITGRIAGEYVQTQWGPLRIATASRHGREATFTIRPEHVRLLDGPALNTVPGIMQGVTYHGEFIAYRVMVGTAEVRIKAYGACPHLPLGTPVYVQFPAEHMFEVLVR